MRRTTVDPDLTGSQRSKTWLWMVQTGIFICKFILILIFHIQTYIQTHILICMRLHLFLYLHKKVKLSFPKVIRTKAKLDSFYQYSRREMNLQYLSGCTVDVKQVYKRTECPTKIFTVRY